MHAVFQQFVVVKQWEQIHLKQLDPGKAIEMAEALESSDR
jgi:hypothetical protein